MNIKKKEYVELTYLYFKYRNLFDYGFQKYLFFKNLISYVCNISNYSMIRRIHEDLQKRNVFTIKKMENQIWYCFNPYNKIIDETPDISISWT